MVALSLTSIFLYFGIDQVIVESIVAVVSLNETPSIRLQGSSANVGFSSKKKGSVNSLPVDLVENNCKMAGELGILHPIEFK